MRWIKSASERVLALMKKNCTSETMLSNLADGTSAGIWMHCFLFFGFPGETESEARETYDFVLDNANKIASFGCGAFTLEHNAPISKHFSDFGVSIEGGDHDNLDVYYKYGSDVGLSHERAQQWADRLNHASVLIPKYKATNWIPREHLFTFLSKMTMTELIDIGGQLHGQRCVLNDVPLSKIMIIAPVSPQVPPFGEKTMLINRLNRRSILVSGNANKAIF